MSCEADERDKLGDPKIKRELGGLNPPTRKWKYFADSERPKEADAKTR